MRASDRDRNLHMLRASERRLAASICEFTEGPDYTVYRSEAFPHFYAGNGLVAHRRLRKSLDDWVDLFQRNFPAERYNHITVVLPQGTADDALLADAAARGFHVVTEVLMAAPLSAIATGMSSTPAAQIATLAGEDDMRRLYELHLGDARAEDWFVDEPGFADLFGKTITVSRAVGVQWRGIQAPGAEGGLHAALGFFDEAKLCRLQEVMTAPLVRSRGLATLLIGEVAARARARGVEAIGLFAEDGGAGHRLYRKLGFQELARDVTLMHY